MKKALSLLAAVAVLAIGTTAMAASMLASKHDMTKYGTTLNSTGTNKEVCVFCHTPHNASRTRALWNRSNSTSTFALYTSGANEESSNWYMSGSKEGTITAGSASLMCLSCHDGATSIKGNVVNAKGTITLTNDTVTGNANLGSDLTNDHPINFNYANVQSAGNQTGKLVAATGTMVGTAKLIEGALECASCHDVHNTTNVPFLRETIQGSQLCLQCHIK
ncbi:MAG: cytochrome c3 family protein [Geobacter sp.]|nr:cytochrome c3 family protein [Geobacter sp.]